MNMLYKLYDFFIWQLKYDWTLAYWNGRVISDDFETPYFFRDFGSRAETSIIIK